MKLTGACPKCRSTDIIRAADEALGGGVHTQIALSVWSSVNAPWFVCTNCGYAERWVESAVDQQKLREALAKRGPTPPRPPEVT